MRPLPLFEPLQPADAQLIQNLRRGQADRKAGSMLVAEGSTQGPLYTLFSGWAFRFKTLSDGRRQILNFLLPGDFIGLQRNMTDAAVHGVEALTDVRLCVFERDALWSLHREAPRLGFVVTWLAAHEEAAVDENLLSVGRRSALERVATLLVVLYKRIAALADPPSDGVDFPLTQQHIADALGLSLVHTHRTLRRLQRMGLHQIDDGRLRLLDVTALKRIADLYGDGKPPTRPLI
jgi:CRP/FNR family transcriptional regulator, anaerobic regulatory protein